jgi:tetratricopeptide (TPR) repeat protein
MLCRLAAIATLACGAVAHANEVDCGSLDNAYGPYDYTNADHRANKIPIVDTNHFLPEIEALIRVPNGLGSIMNNLDYTLRAVPNHHRALASVALYSLRGMPQESYRTADCYFDRALRFKPDDGVVHGIYASYLQRKGKFAEAETEYREALRLLPQDNSEVRYNLGLLYSDPKFTDAKKLEQAKQYAIEAYTLGYPLRGLRNRLARAGKWTAADDTKVFKSADTATATPR